VLALGLSGEEMAGGLYSGWENPARVQFTPVDLGPRGRPPPFHRPCSCRLTAPARDLHRCEKKPVYPVHARAAAVERG